MDRVVLIMAKQPIAGSSKTRLTPVLTDDEAAELSACFIADTVTAMVDLAAADPGFAVTIAGTPASAGPYFAELVPTAGFVAQRGPSLGHRLANVMTDALSGGASMVVAVNSDSPTLPPSLVADAFELLADDDVDVVLGPAEDGGYYLIGWKRPHPRMVTDVKMSTPDVLSDTLAIAAEDGLAVSLTEPWFDVDQPADLDRVRSDLNAGRFCGPATTAFLLARPQIGVGSRSRR
ncbi:MAG: TIGR04282 family arsenosugar biosynthesis glycosyltransferase [Actinomycetota bacterium]